MAKRAVLLLAHGTPDTVDEIPAYLRNVVSGRPMPQHVIEEIQHRYALIGHSPLTEITLEQARLLEALLAHQTDQPVLNQGDAPMRVYVGMRNWKPYIPDVIRQMRADGVTEAAVICLAPQNSRTSVGLYRRAVEAEAQASESDRIRIDFTAAWADHPLLAQAFAERLEPAWNKLTAETGATVPVAAVPVLFTAHSVPCRTIQTPAVSEGQTRMWPGEGTDPYAEEARRTATLVAAQLPQIPTWYFAFQSQGASGGPWIGPTVESTLDALAQQGVTALILQPIGFVCDHVEVLYDIDIAFREYAAKHSIRLERPESLNNSPTLTRVLADLCRKAFMRLDY